MPMRFELRLLNCFWLLLPLLLWNFLLGPKITIDKILSDTHSPQWLLALENITRLVVFILPLLIPLVLNDRLSKIGLALYIAGTLIYFVSWLPLLLSPHSSWSTSAAGLLAPRLTPLLPFLGIAMIGHNWIYGIISILFIFLHTWHGIYNL